MNGANLDDLLTLLAVVRDALATGHVDLAEQVLRLLLEHRGERAQLRPFLAQSST